MRTRHSALRIPHEIRREEIFDIEENESRLHSLVVRTERNGLSSAKNRIY